MQIMDFSAADKVFSKLLLGEGSQVPVSDCELELPEWTDKKKVKM